MECSPGQSGDNGAFDTPEQWRFDWERPYSRDQWLDQLPTHGGHSRLPSRQIETLLAEVGTVIDGLGGRFTMPYAAVAVTAVLAGGST